MQTDQQSVDIIIPCFNRWPHIREAIDSVLNQTWVNAGCIVVDDASNDNSLTHLREHYADEPRVRVVGLDKNQGQSAARNHGACQSQSDYIAFLDSDDLLINTAIESRMNMARKKPDFEGIIFGDKVDGKTGKSLLPGSMQAGEKLGLSEYIQDFSWIHTNSFIMKREAFHTLEGFNRKLRKKEDIEFFIRALQEQDAIYAPGPCCVIRGVDDQRARHDHTRIIEQGEKFIEAIEANQDLALRLTPGELKKLVEADTKSMLHSLYRSRQAVLFRNTLITKVRQRKIRLNAKLARRYLLSFTQR